ncbi:MAG: hypothetical protein CME16_01900 [Gemmatimonadetes bacterium]|nr:hypothetical protein [Gemmatimonadota bacterium]
MRVIGTVGAQVDLNLVNRKRSVKKFLYCLENHFLLIRLLMCPGEYKFDLSFTSCRAFAAGIFREGFLVW